MRLAFPAPDRSLADVTRLAADHRLDLELHAGRDPRHAVATNLLFTDPAKVAALMASAGVRLASVTMAVPAAAVVDELARAAAAAAAAGCGLVRLIETRPTPPPVLRSAALAAAAVGVRLTLTNTPVRNGIADLWRRIDAVDHPALGAALDTGHAAAGGDGPSLAVPTLGSRILHVRLGHPATDADAVHRLAGIGYAGPLSIDGRDLATAAAAVRSWLVATTPAPA